MRLQWDKCTIRCDNLECKQAKREQSLPVTITFNVGFREAKEAQQAHKLKNLMPYIMPSTKVDSTIENT